MQEEPLDVSREFDHRVRELHLCEGQQTAQDARGDQLVDLDVHFLHANTTAIR
jgi:hypothetical protein